MFKRASRKLYPSSAIPDLAGNPGSTHLQEAINNEDLVLQSLQRLSESFDKTTHALRAWAGDEGEDLKDTFSACAILLNHWSESLKSFTSHITKIRECLKTVRTKEEALDKMRDRRRSLSSKVGSAEKKLRRTRLGNGNLRPRSSLFSGLCGQLHELDMEILGEEASFGDWKRAKAREWMGVLFGGLLECSEKGTVVATFGRDIIGYVSTEKTQPLHPRARYSGHAQVKDLVREAERGLEEISFVGEVGTLKSPNESRIWDTPGIPRSSFTSLIRPTPTRAPRSYTSLTFPSTTPSSLYERSDFGERNPGSRSQTNSLRPAGPTRSSTFASLSPLGGFDFTPVHQLPHSQSSPRLGTDFTLGYPSPIGTPALHPTCPSNDSGCGLTPEHEAPTDDTFPISVAKTPGDGSGLDEKRNEEPPSLGVDGPPSTIDNVPALDPPIPPGLPHTEGKPTFIHNLEVDDEGVGLSPPNQTNDNDPNHSDKKPFGVRNSSGFRGNGSGPWESMLGGRDDDFDYLSTFLNEAIEWDV